MDIRLVPVMGGEHETGEDMYDVIVIGGGPAGTTAAIYTARADLKTLVLDKGLTAGALGMTSRIANYPGVPREIGGAELLERMRSQAQSFGAHLVQDKVLSTSLRGEIKEISGGKGSYHARALIIATGSMGRTQTVRGEEELVGRGISYCVTCDGAFFRDQEVAVAGNKGPLPPWPCKGTFRGGIGSAPKGRSVRDGEILCWLLDSSKRVSGAKIRHHTVQSAIYLKSITA